MSQHLDISPQAEANLVAIARKAGVDPNTLAGKIIEEQFAPVGGQASPTLTAKNAAAIAYLDRRLQEEATDDPEELRKAEAEVAELMQYLNKNRIESGERPLFP